MIQGAGEVVTDRVVPVFDSGSWLAAGGAAHVLEAAPAPAAGAASFGVVGSGPSTGA